MMGHPKILNACLLACCGSIACTSSVDVALRSGTEGGTTFTGAAGSSNDFAGAPTTTSAAGGVINDAGGSSSAPGGTSTAAGGTTSAAAGMGPVEIQRSTLPAVTNPELSDAEYAAFIGDSNAFGLELQQQLVATQDLASVNNVFSPVSAQLALAMTYGAAAGATAVGMKTTLHDELGEAKYHAACNRLTRELASRNYSNTDSYGYTRRIELAPANSLWTDRTLPIKTPYLDLLAQQYDSGMRRVDFLNQPNASRLAINAWVEDETRGKIVDLLLEPDINGNTRFVIANALYFYGTWQTLFDKRVTQPGAFHTLAGLDVTVDQMHESSTFAYKSNESTEVLKLPYVTGNLWMTLVLPAAGQFETTRAQISREWLASMTDGLTSNYIQLTLPKFKIATPQLLLKDGLSALGMADAFTDQADFSGMTDLKGLYLSKVIQKAFIGVDEDGTEAAAATAVIGEWLSIPPLPIVVTFDRPFLFFIQDKTGLVLFSGQVVDPTQ